MEFGYIGGEQLPLFSSLLLPDAVRALQRGEPLTALGICQDGVACGALAGFAGEGCFHIVSLYVAPDFRRQGGGRMLVKETEAFLRAHSDLTAMDIQYAATEPEHQDLAPFLSAMGFAPEDREETLYAFTLAQAAMSPLLSIPGKPSPNVLPFSQIPDAALRAAQKEALLQDVPLPELPLTSPELDRELSHALVKDQRVQAFVVCDHSCGGMPTLSCAWSGQAGPTVLTSLLKSVFRRASELYPPETRAVLQAITPAAAALTRAILPEAASVSFSYYRTFSQP